MSKKEEIRERIKNTTKKSKKIKIAKLGDSVVVRELSALQFTEISEACVNSDKSVDSKKFITLAVLFSTYTLEGEQLWDREDIKEVESLPFYIFEPLSTAVVELNNLNEATNKQKK